MTFAAGPQLHFIKISHFTEVFLSPRHAFHVCGCVRHGLRPAGFPQSLPGDQPPLRKDALAQREAAAAGAFRLSINGSVSALRAP